jgi:hypothetical protein
MDFTITYIAEMIYRRANESDRAWARRRKSAYVRHRKAEKQRFRECQRTGRTYYPHRLDAINVPFRLRSLDVGKITTGTLRADTISAGVFDVKNITDGGTF